MTKRDYIELAADYKRLRTDHDYAPRPFKTYLEGIDAAIDLFCAAAKRDNRNFRRDTFIAACGRSDMKGE
jgi:hypothetical protein